MDIKDEVEEQLNLVRRELNRQGFNVPEIEEFSEIHTIAAERGRVSFARLSPDDANPLAQAVGGDVMCKIRRQPEHNARVELDTTWCPHYDETYPQATFFHAYIFSHNDGDTEVFIHAPLEDANLWREVAAAYLNNETLCGAHNQPDCQYYEGTSSWIDLQPFANKRGESIPIVHICEQCRDRLYVDGWFADRYLGTGPLPWFDDGPRLLPETDPFDSPDAGRPLFGDGWFDDPNWD